MTAHETLPDGFFIDCGASRFAARHVDGWCGYWRDSRDEAVEDAHTEAAERLRPAMTTEEFRGHLLACLHGPGGDEIVREHILPVLLKDGADAICDMVESYVPIKRVTRLEMLALALVSGKSGDVRKAMALSSIKQRLAQEIREALAEDVSGMDIPDAAANLLRELGVLP